MQMTEVSKKWNSQDALAGLQGEVAAMMQGGFRLVGAIALVYVSNVYWAAPKIQAKETTEQVHKMLESLNYGKSSKYQLATAGMQLARNWSRKYGAPDAAKDRNVFYGMVQDCETFSDAVDIAVAAIKADYGVDTLNDLYHALAGTKATTTKAEKTLEEKVMAAIGKEDDMTADRVAKLGASIAATMPEGQALAIAAMLNTMTLEQVNQIAVMVNARMAELTAPAEDVKQAA